MNVMKPSAIVTRIGRHLRNAYSLDLRSLAVFRVLVALVILADLAQRLGDAKVLYSDAGILPRATAISIVGMDRWSLFFLNGSPEFASLLIIIGMIAAALMLVGWHTRAATILLWIVVVSVQSRNNHVSYGADTLIRLSLFWGMFLPLGASWSFDSQRYSKPVASAVSSIASFALIAQIASMYFFTAMLKKGISWREELDAVYYALGARDLSTWLGEWLFLSAPMQFFSALTVGTLWIEFTIPILLLIPVRAGWLRVVAVGLVLALHLGIASSMTVGLFPAISIASIAVVLPSGFWAYVFSSGLARSRFWRRFTTDGREAIEEDVANAHHRPLNPGDAQLVRFLPYGGFDTSRITQVAVNVAITFAMVMGLAWNISTVSSHSIPEPMRRTAVVAGLYQDWAMFAPNPRAATNWFIVEGELSSGEKVELMKPIMTGDFSLQHEPVWDQSDDVLLNNERWRKYFQAIRSREREGLQLAGFACRTWNAEDRGRNRLETVTLTFASAITLPNSERAEPVFVEIGNWICH